MARKPSHHLAKSYFPCDNPPIITAWSSRLLDYVPFLFYTVTMGSPFDLPYSVELWTTRLTLRSRSLLPVITGLRGLRSMRRLSNDQAGS